MIAENSGAGGGETRPIEDDSVVTTETSSHLVKNEGKCLHRFIRKVVVISQVYSLFSSHVHHCQWYSSSPELGYVLRLLVICISKV